MIQASLSARYYYNLERRSAADKISQHNSGDYLSLGVQYTSPIVAHWGQESIYSSTYPQGLGNTASVRFVWGIQRQLHPKRFYYDLSAGFLVDTNRPVYKFQDALTAQIVIGYCLTK
ncbi:hypothetical protein GCM10028773_22900 [Spirosoma koreense]